jgi:hypothetical protein
MPCSRCRICPNRTNEWAVNQFLGSEGCQPNRIYGEKHSVYGNSYIYHEKAYGNGHQGCHCVAWQCPSSCGLHCPGHTVLHTLEGVGPHLIQPRSITVWLPCIWSLKKEQDWVGWRHEGRGGVVAPTEAWSQTRRCFTTNAFQLCFRI